MFAIEALSIFRVKHRFSFLFLLIISVCRGWCLIQIPDRPVLVTGHIKFIVFPPFLINNLFGLYRNYFYLLRLKGMGIKMLCCENGVVFKLGFSHKLLLLKLLDSKFFFITRKSLMVRGRNGSLLRDLVSGLAQLRTTAVYKKKGVFLRGSIGQLKLTSKKSKF